MNLLSKIWNQISTFATTALARRWASWNFITKLTFFLFIISKKKAKKGFSRFSCSNHRYLFEEKKNNKRIKLFLIIYFYALTQ